MKISGQKVKMLDGDRWCYGFTTVVREHESKVLFEFPDTGLAYWYYNNIELIDITDEEYLKAKVEHNEA